MDSNNTKNINTKSMSSKKNNTTINMVPDGNTTNYEGSVKQTKIIMIHLNMIPSKKAKIHHM